MDIDKLVMVKDHENLNELMPSREPTEAMKEFETKILQWEQERPPNSFQATHAEIKQYLGFMTRFDTPPDLVYCDELNKCYKKKCDSSFFDELDWNPENQEEEE